MIAACPKCSARYRIGKADLRPDGVRIRCSRCEAIFRVRTPNPQVLPGSAREDAVSADSSDTSEPNGASAPPFQVATAPAGRTSEIDTTPPAPNEGAIRVLVADPLVEEGKATANALAEWGVQPFLVHDGVEAILAIQRILPAAVIIDAALPKMYGFQICELLKRNESLRHIHVVLVGAIYDRQRYRRDPTELYGADAYLERPQLPEALWPMLRGFGLPLGSGRQDAERASVPVSDSSPEAMPEPVAGEALPSDREPAVPDPRLPEPRVESQPEVAEQVSDLPPAQSRPAPEADKPGLDPEIAKAERLARIVVSDIILYNQDKFDSAVRSGDVVAAMGSDLEEGRALFTQRIDARVREKRDFLTDELVRVAGMRRSQ